MLLKNGVNIIFRNCRVSNFNYADTGGLFRLENNVTLLIDNITFTSKFYRLF